MKKEFNKTFSSIVIVLVIIISAGFIYVFSENLTGNAPYGASAKSDSLSCIDSDKSQDIAKSYYTKGYITYKQPTLLSNKYITSYDSCKDINIILEQACSSTNKNVQVTYKCPNGCKDGTCNKVLSTAIKKS